MSSQSSNPWNSYLVLVRKMVRKCNNRKFAVRHALHTVIYCFAMPVLAAAEGPEIRTRLSNPWLPSRPRVNSLRQHLRVQLLQQVVGAGSDGIGEALDDDV